MKAVGLSLFLALAGMSANVAAQERIAPRTGPLTVDSTVGELLDNAPARTVLERQLPILVKNPEVRQASALSLRALAQYMPTILTTEKLKAIDAELARTPGAIASANSPRPVAGMADLSIALNPRTVRLWEGRAPGATGRRIFLLLP